MMVGWSLVPLGTPIVITLCRDYGIYKPRNGYLNISSVNMSCLCLFISVLATFLLLLFCLSPVPLLQARHSRPAQLCILGEEFFDIVWLDNGRYSDLLLAVLFGLPVRRPDQYRYWCIWRQVRELWRRGV